MPLGQLSRWIFVCIESMIRDHVWKLAKWNLIYKTRIKCQNPSEIKKLKCFKRKKDAKFAYKLTTLTNCIECYLETLKFWYLYWLSNKEDTQRTTSCTRSKEKIPRHSPLPHSTLDMHSEPKKDNSIWKLLG